MEEIKIDLPHRVIMRICSFILKTVVESVLGTVLGTQYRTANKTENLPSCSLYFNGDNYISYIQKYK